MKLACSVVIPLYNKEYSIKRAICSVLSQVVTNFELIVVNDGSTDGSLEVVKAIKDKRLRIIDQENAGECGARNKGIAEARFDLVAFLDADDEWTPEFLSGVLKLAEVYSDCGLFGSFYQVSAGMEDFNLLDNNFLPLGWSGILENYYEILSKYSYSPFCSSSVMVRKQTLLKIGGFPHGVKRGGDLSTWFRLSRETSFAFINLPLSIIHFDAENRATVMYEKPLENYYPITTLLEMLHEGRFSGSEIQYVVEYIARHQVRVSRHYLRQGENSKARSVLKTFMKTKVYRRTWLKYYVYSLLPVPLSKTFIDRRP